MHTIFVSICFHMKIFLILMKHKIVSFNMIREINIRFLLNQLKSDCIYHFSIDLELNGTQFGLKSIRKL